MKMSSQQEKTSGIVDEQWEERDLDDMNFDLAHESALGGLKLSVGSNRYRIALADMPGNCKT